jgi:radical SAM superfamily enzyme YgiQ (UPF0313 family)
VPTSEAGQLTRRQARSVLLVPFSGHEEMQVDYDKLLRGRVNDFLSVLKEEQHRRHKPQESGGKRFLGLLDLNKLLTIKTLTREACQVRLDIYHLYQHIDYANMGYPIMIDVLKLWAEELGWKVRVCVCREKNVNLSTDADIVAFSVYTQTAPATYRLAEKLRDRGKLAVLGGPHFRGSDPEEGSAVCDVLVHSICKTQWQSLLNEVEDGALCSSTAQARYIKDSDNRFRYPDNLGDSAKSQSWWQVAAVPTSLGCPYDCSFCNPYMQGEYHLRDIDTIVGEIARFPTFRPVFLADATTGLNKQHTVELMRRVAPLGRKLLVESTLKRLQDPQLLDALAEGGTKWITVGVESFNSKLGKLGADAIADSMARLLDGAHERGIMIEGNFICGLDSDGLETFDEIYEFYNRSTLDLIVIDILTPYPNTRLYDELKAAGRIIDRNWEHYDYRHVVYRPKKMSEEQLADRFNQLYCSLYSGQMVARKMKSAFAMGGFSMQTLGALIYNTYGMCDAHRKKRALTRNKRHVELLKRIQFVGDPADSHHSAEVA